MQRKGQRGGSAALVLGLVLLATATALAVAPMKTFQPTEKIVAADVNANFKVLADAVSALEQHKANPYCGKTALKTGSTGGYVGVRALCQALPSCGPSARVCTGPEVVAAASAGEQLDNGWYAAGVAVADTTDMDDCTGFTSNSSALRGCRWASATNSPSVAFCNAQMPVLCCR
ncbi:MAG: hypothetical protein L6Q84_08480 [Polyangiaceae bacterium]|nr:hypothetical protein [Polyangiaceae bacterium]